MFKKTIQLALLISLILAANSSTVLAAGKPAPAPDTRTGIDVSWPQCGKTLPTKLPFAIVGVNGGTANTTNECLAAQLTWATTTTTGANPNQPAVQLYVNTGNPYDDLEEYAVTSWPTDNLDSRGVNTLDNPDARYRNPYGACVKTPGNYLESTNSLACNWQYGWNRAVEDVDIRFKPAATQAAVNADPTTYKWWFDVETMNSWQSAGTPEAYANNTATLEGMAHFFTAEGITKTGLYSTAYQWSQIVGNTLGTSSTGANLKNLDSWLAGAINAKDAQKRCTTLAGLTGGPVVLNQYISRSLDYNYSCK